MKNLLQTKKACLKKLCFAFLLSFASVVLAQAQVTVKGIVVDEANEPLIGVTVAVKSNTSIGTLSDIDGRFSLTVPNEKTVLTFSFVGFKTQERTATTQEVKIVMHEDAALLDEVIVVGYGMQKKSDLTGGISSISGDVIDKIPATSLGQRLQGQIPGLNISNVSSKPGEETSIRIRGERSLTGNNNPLIIVDGVPFEGNLSEVDQNSVEAISVLRDASSATIYGSRAANGVILITTKKGKAGKPTVKYNGYVGIQMAEYLPKAMKGEEYIELNKQYRRDFNRTAADKDKIDWEHPDQWLLLSIRENYANGKTVDWVDEVFNTAVQQEHQISLSGATDATNYYLSLSLTDQNGIVKNSNYKKYAITSNISQKLDNWLTIGANIQLLERDRGGATPNTGYVYRMSPYGNLRDEDGTYTRYPMHPETVYYSPFADMEAVRDNKSRAAYISGFADIKFPVTGLSYRANVGYSYRQQKIGDFYHGANTFTGATTSPIPGKAEIEDKDWGSWIWENIVRYDRDFGKHHLDFTGLFSAQRTRAAEHKSTGTGFLPVEKSYHNIKAALSTKDAESKMGRTSMLSLMGRINYAFDKRYLLTATLRRDGSSLFGENNKWALFPAVAGAWVISEEKFFDGIKDDVEFLKLRLSYGGVGNQPGSANPYDNTFSKLSQADYIYGNEASYSGGLINTFKAANKNLKWETTYTTNIGIDFTLKNNRLSGNFDFYIADTKDLLMNRSVPIMNGYDTFLDNVGKTRNKGFDISLSSINIQKADFQWNSSLSIGANWSEVRELQGKRDKDGNLMDDISNKWFLGESLSVFYDYKIVGIWQEDEAEEMAKTSYFGGKYQPIAGDPKLHDADGDGKITESDKVIIGNRLPVWNVGLGNTFTYKNLSLSVFLNGVFDLTKENETVKFERQLFDKQVNYISGINYWTPESKSNEYTRLNYRRTEHSFYRSGAYLRIQDVNLAYQFPKHIANKIGLQALTTYVNGKNLYTFSGAKKFTANVEQRQKSGEAFALDKYSLDGAGYPSQRVFVFGVNVTF